MQNGRLSCADVSPSRLYGQPTWSTVTCDPRTTMLSSSSMVNGRRTWMARIASSVVRLLPTQK